MSIPAFVRQHVRENGTPKIAYPSAKAAASAVVGATPRQYAYECSLCGKWHLAAGDGKHRARAPEIPWYGDAS
jgi:hypothetical protein